VQITVEEIIFNPKSPEPGDTLQATAVVTSSNPSGGTFVSYVWTATGGELLETDKASVRWVAPAQSAIYSLSVSAKNDVNTSTSSGDVFVCPKDEFIAERAGQLFALPTGGSVYYTSPPAGKDDGLIIRFTDGTTDQAPFGLLDWGQQFTFDENRTISAHTYVELALPPKTTVLYDDLVATSRAVVARDERPFPARPNPYEAPSVSQDGQFIAYQGGLFDQSAPPSQGGTDTFTVYLYDVVGHASHRATFKGHSQKPNVSNSFYPSVSSNNQHLVFVSDRSSPAKYELYALPIVGTTVTPDTVQGALVRLTDTGGLMASGTSVPPAAIPMVWNPGSTPILAAIASDNRLRLVPTDGSGAVLVATPGDVKDMVWASNGQFLAIVVNVEGVYTIFKVTTDGAIAPVFTAIAGDRAADLSWSPDSEFLLYSIRRGSTSWYEVIDVGGSTGVTGPVRVSPALGTGNAAGYATTQTLRPAWRAGTRTAYVFYLDQETPRVFSIGISGIGE
jgi:hypothetical protein